MEPQYLATPFETATREWAWEARLLRWLTFLWLFLGAIALFSASYPFASDRFGDGLYYFKRQIAWALVGLVGFFFAARTPTRLFLENARWLLLLLLGTIWLTAIPGVGTTINGATRWLEITGLLVQPSEPIKPFLVLQAAIVFGRWQQLSPHVRWRWILVFVAVVLGVLAQPNLSTAALCGIVLWLMALGAGLPYRHLLGAAAGGLGLALASLALKEYQRRRIFSFLNPWADPYQDGYQLVQSLLAVGSGGIWGEGLGMSQQKLFYLPIQHSDFIFSVYAEEFGFAGSLFLLLLLSAYATLGLMVALKSRSPVRQLAIIGLVTVLVGQAALNIGVAVGVLPTTGIPLPLFSYGGSSIIASLFSAGLLVRFARESHVANVVAFPDRRELSSRRKRHGVSKRQSVVPDWSDRD